MMIYITVFRCIYVKVINYTYFLDTSKDFDKLNHDILFHRLTNNNVSSYIINYLNYCYSNQRIYIKWF